MNRLNTSGAADQYGENVHTDAAQKRTAKSFSEATEMFVPVRSTSDPLLFPRWMYIYIRSKCGPFKYECPRCRPTPPFFTPAPLISPEYFHISCGWLMITLHCLMRSIRLPALSLWEADICFSLGVSLLKDNNNNNNKKTPQWPGKYFNIRCWWREKRQFEATNEPITDNQRACSVRSCGRCLLHVADIT